MDPVREHRWDVSVRAAREIQEGLRALRRERGLPRRIGRIGGADVSYDKGSDRFFAAIVVMRFPSLEVIEVAGAEGKAAFPYVPGYLVFREGPILLAAARRLSLRPDVLVFDGHGLAHPRRFGIACHLGVLLDVPSIGCGKTILCGEHREPAKRLGSRRPLIDRGETVGAALRTRAGVKPVYVSAGHRMTLDAACRIILDSCAGYRLPEPTRRAHLEVNRMRREHR